MVGDVVEGLVELDSRVFRTLWGLTVRPGRVTREYLDGRRIVYINPFKYALVAVTLAFVVLPWLELQLGLREASESAEAVEWGKLVNVIALPITAGVMSLLFWEKRLRYIEHLVLVLYAHGHTFVLQTVLGMAMLLVLPEWSIVMVVVPYWWLGWTARDVMGAGWISSMLRSAVAFTVVLFGLPQVLRPLLDLFS